MYETLFSNLIEYLGIQDERLIVGMGFVVLFVFILAINILVACAVLVVNIVCTGFSIFSIYLKKLLVGEIK